VVRVQRRVAAENIEHIFAAADVPRDLDLLSIDIDLNDYHVWRAIAAYRPKLVVIEFNASYPPPQRFVVPYHPDSVWDGSDYYGASIQSLYELGRSKGYELLHCEGRGVNLFFVEARFFPRFDIRDNDPLALYRPPDYGMAGYGRGPNGRGHPRMSREAFQRRLVEDARRELLDTIPARQTLILVDQEQSGLAAVLGDRHRLPFLERDGVYWGLPPDDATAVAELERLRSVGAAFFVVAWPAFWWFEYYGGLREHLRDRYPCVLATERIMVFALGGAAAHAEPPEGEVIGTCR
jgi:hypothetical protein